MRIGTTTIAPDDSGAGSVGWAFDPNPGTSDLDGIPLLDTPETPDVYDDPVDHPNGIVSIDHVVVSSDDPARTSRAFEDAGFPQRRSIVTERFGSPLRQSFHWAGDVIIEVIGPAGPPSSSRGDDTADVAAPTHRAGITATGGSKLFGITFVTTDMDRTIDALGPLAGEPRPAVQPGRYISTIDTRALAIGTRLAVMTPHRSRRT